MDPNSIFNNCSPQTLMDKCILDYMKKKRFKKAATIFAKEAGLTIDEHFELDGFMSDWWGLFWDVYSSKTRNNLVASQGKNMINVEQTRFILSQSRPPRGTRLPRERMNCPQHVNLDQIFQPDAEAMRMKLEQLTAMKLKEEVGSYSPQEMSISPPESTTNRDSESSGQEKDTNVVREGTSTVPRKVLRCQNGNRPTVGQLRLRQKEGGHDVEVDKPMTKDDEVDYFLSRNNGNVLNDISFKEIAAFDTSYDKVLCCHFSSDGKLIAGGHNKKVTIWNVESRSFVGSTANHSGKITDVRFKPHSTVFATSSDTTVQLWDAADVTKSPVKLEGHTKAVMCVDFYASKRNNICSCDCNGEIRLWNIDELACIRVFKINGAIRQVRFQNENYFAAASRNTIRLSSFNNHAKYLRGHEKDVSSICWDTSGTYLASVSEDRARIWSAKSDWKCKYELHSNGNIFRSCVFHPARSLLLVIGSYQTIELWDCVEGNKTRTIQAHCGMIYALANSPQAGLIASASHDCCLKLWR